jgi:ATP-binding cassette subfamily B protein
MKRAPDALRILIGCIDRRMASRILCSTLLACAGGLVAGLAPLALKRAVDTLVHGDVEGRGDWALESWLVVYLTCLCAGRLATEIRPSCTGDAEQRLLSSLRLRFFRHVLALPLGFHLERRSGALAHTLQQACTGAQIALLSLVNGIVPVLVEGLTVMAVMLSIAQPALAFTSAATAALYFWVTTSRTHGLSQTAKGVSETSAEGASILADSLTNIESMQTFGLEHKAIRQYANVLEELQARWHDLRSHRLTTGLLTAAVFALSMGMSLAVAVHELRRGGLTVGGFVLVTLYLVQMARPLESLASAARDLSQGLGFMAQLAAILNVPLALALDVKPNAHTDTLPAPLQAERAVSAQTMQASTQGPGDRPASPGVRLRHVRLAYEPGRPLFTDLNLEIPAGQTVALVGRSGCGKSSIARLLLRLCEPQSGEVLLGDRRAASMSVAELRALIAVVPQDTVLFNSTLGANIAVGRESAAQADIARAARLAGLEGFIATLPLGYETRIGERGLMISGGERQRIAIARAVLRNPRIYVFDEATSMLDGDTEAAVLQNLREISIGRTTLMIAHRLSAVQHADQIAFIADGQVAELGTHDALMAKDGRYAMMWQAQQNDRSSRCHLAPDKHLRWS